MKESFQDRYKKTCQLAENQVDDFAQIVVESFDDFESLGEFVDTLFYMHSISDDEHFASFLRIIYEIMGGEILVAIDCHLTTTATPFLFYNCFLLLY